MNPAHIRSCIETARALKEEGNALINTSPEKARSKYLRMLPYITGISADETVSSMSAMLQISAPSLPKSMVDECRQLECIAHVNTALTWLKEANYRNCIASCTSALAIEPTNVKALYRRAKAFYLQRDLASALADLDKIPGHDDTNVESLRTAISKATEQSDQRLGAKLKNAFNKSN